MVRGGQFALRDHISRAAWRRAHRGQPTVDLSWGMTDPGRMPTSWPQEARARAWDVDEGG